MRLLHCLTSHRGNGETPKMSQGDAVECEQESVLVVLLVSCQMLVYLLGFYW